LCRYCCVIFGFLKLPEAIRNLFFLKRGTTTVFTRSRKSIRSGHWFMEPRCTGHSCKLPA